MFIIFSVLMMWFLSIYSYLILTSKKQVPVLTFFIAAIHNCSIHSLSFFPLFLKFKMTKKYIYQFVMLLTNQEKNLLSWKLSNDGKLTDCSKVLMPGTPCYVKQTSCTNFSISTITVYIFLLWAQLDSARIRVCKSIYYRSVQLIVYPYTISSHYL